MSEPDVSDLLTVQQAIAILDGVPVSPRVVEVDLAHADGLILAEDVRADRDYPPFDKSLMDGFAVRCADVAQAPTELSVIGEIPAGQHAARGLAAGETYAIMTGAPLPEGADGVIAVENSQRIGGERVRFAQAALPNRFIARRGSEVIAGAVVLERGTALGPAQLAVAATVGAARVNVFAKPRAAVLATGDELVEISTSPGAAQIRNSTSVTMVALLTRLGCDVRDLGIARDDPNEIRDAIERGLHSDVLFVSGGMSRGEYDYVPKILRELGVELRITKLKIKPGKPFVFGRHEGTKARRHEGDEKAPSSPSSPSVPPCLRASVPSSFVFGLPGNPVSGFVCTVRLASRLIARLRGADPEPRWLIGRLTEALPANGPREFYQPVLLNPDGDVTPLAWKGSADVFTLAQANGLLVRPENELARQAGSSVRVLEVPR